MHARLLLSIPLLIVLATFAAAFAPAPVFKEPAKPSLPAIAKAMQGTWSVALNSKGKSNRLMRVRIQDKTWTNFSLSKGPARPAIAYEILLETNRTPVALDLKPNTTSRVTMKGIVKIEENRLIFCYVSSDSEEERPKAFTDTQTPTGRRVMTMTLTKAE